jgi:phospholipid/cholesterol/gamma-HCH transport system substrate-binding protein
MNERQLQFRVGLFVITALTICAVLIIQFGDIQKYLEESYQIAIHFESTPGLHPGTPVRQNGIGIGKVANVLIDEEHGGVLVVVDVRTDRKLRKDARPVLVSTLLGDTSIEFSAGASKDMLPPNTRIEGVAAADPMRMIQQIEVQVSDTLTAFAATSQEWRTLASNVNRLVQTQEGDLDVVIERAAQSLHEFTQTMKTANTTLTSANEILADPQLQKDLKATIAALPAMVSDTRETIAAARQSVQKVSENLDNLSQATDPLAEHSRSIVVKLDGSLGQLESLLTELNAFARVANSEDGSLNRFVSDPQLYENLNQSAESLNLLVRSLEPILHDVRVFSDKVARHPELIGVSGAIKGSSGIKDAPEQPARRSILQTGGTK